MNVDRRQQRLLLSVNCHATTNRDHAGTLATLQASNESREQGGQGRGNAASVTVNFHPDGKHPTLSPRFEYDNKISLGGARTQSGTGDTNEVGSAAGQPLQSVSHVRHRTNIHSKAQLEPSCAPAGPASTSTRGLDKVGSRVSVRDPKQAGGNGTKPNKRVKSAAWDVRSGPQRGSYNTLKLKYDRQSARPTAQAKTTGNWAQ